MVDVLRNEYLEEDDIVCFGCQHFEYEVQTDWESGIKEWDVYCYAKDQHGNDLYEENVNSSFPIFKCAYKEE